MARPGKSCARTFVVIFVYISNSFSSRSVSLRNRRQIVRRVVHRTG